MTSNSAATPRDTHLNLRTMSVSLQTTAFTLLLYHRFGSEDKNAEALLVALVVPEPRGLGTFDKIGPLWYPF